MKYTQSVGEKSTVKLTISFTEEEWQDAISKAYLKTRGKYTVPGFRKGKAPKPVLENYYGKGLFYEEALNYLYSQNYYTILENEKKNFTAVGEPDLSVEDMTEGKGVTLGAVVPVKPEVKIDAYTGLKIKKYEYNVTDADVEAEVKKLLERNAKPVDVTDRACENGDTVISQWATPWHGLDALANGWNIVLGIAVTLLAMMLACQYFMNSVADETVVDRARQRMLPFALGFVVCFVAWLVRLLFAVGYAADPATGAIVAEPGKYLHNLLAMPCVAVVLLAGVLLVLWSIHIGWRGSRKAIWFGGSGTVLAVLALLLCAGWNNTAYYPSLADMQASLTIRNSSSSLFTLRMMAYVSLLIPFVAAYIWYAWRAIDRTPLTREELNEGGHQY